MLQEIHLLTAFARNIHWILKLITISCLVSCLAVKEEVTESTPTSGASRTKEFTFTTYAIPFNSLSYLMVEVESNDLQEVEIKGSSNKSSISLSRDQVSEGTSIKHLVSPKDEYIEVYIKYENGRAITSRFDSKTGVIKI